MSSEESDSETIEQSSLSYDHLLAEIKIKSTALAKASNLIEILQIEVLAPEHRQLEVEKNSKDEAVREAEETLRQLYENEVSELQFQVKTLKEHRDLPVTHSTELRTHALTQEDKTRGL